LAGRPAVLAGVVLLAVFDAASAMQQFELACWPGRLAGVVLLAVFDAASAMQQFEPRV